MNDGDHFVEIGGWDGRSVAFLASEIESSGKTIIYDVINTFDDVDMFNLFTANTETVKNFFNLKRQTSSDVINSYADNSLSMVFLDRSLNLESLTADINSWLPKVKSGGILAGDDYGEMNWPDVKTAVDSNLNNFSIMGTTWIYTKP